MANPKVVDQTFYPSAPDAARQPHIQECGFNPYAKPPVAPAVQPLAHVPSPLPDAPAPATMAADKAK